MVNTSSRRLVLVVALGGVAAADERGPFVGAVAAWKTDKYEGGSQFHALIGADGGYRWRPWLGAHGSVLYGIVEGNDTEGSDFEVLAGPEARFCEVVCAGARLDAGFGRAAYRAYDSIPERVTRDSWLLEPSLLVGVDLRGWTLTMSAGMRWRDLDFSRRGDTYALEIGYRW